ncbi:NAD(P)-dependent oxidoreductase [Phyllobacterium sp. SB3]|uniref:NAD(P)-dependent oxidoreductase n=1 Tax=Phyllobacterium sp. SB3 TaxID=3156073 RepID=UPI0032AEC27B
MVDNINAPVLILGGTGFVGSRTVRTLRKLYPDLPIAIAGRDQEKARALATEVGNAGAVRVDIRRADLGLDAGAAYAAIIAILKENTLNPLKYAQTQGLPYLSMADGAFEIGPAVAFHMYKPQSAPILLASHWMAGMATLPALHFAKKFRSVHSMQIAVVLDPSDIGGPMANADVEELMQNSPRPLMLDNGTWRWAGDGLSSRNVKDMTGTEIEVHGMSVLDALSLAASTGLNSVRFDYGMGQTEGNRNGGSPSHDMIIEIEGELTTGDEGRARIDIVAPQGVSGLTALGVVLGIERLLGLSGGEPVAPGLYFPEQIIEPAHAIRRLTEFGGQIRQS